MNAQLLAEVKSELTPAIRQGLLGMLQELGQHRISMLIPKECHMESVIPKKLDNLLIDAVSFMLCLNAE